MVQQSRILPLRRLFGALLILALALAPGTVRAQDDDGDGILDADEATLIDAFAPHLFFHPDERYFPTSVQFAFDNSDLEQFQVSGSPVPVDPNPTAASVAAYTNSSDGYYLNNTAGSPRDEAGILSAYRNSTHGEVVYAHVAPAGGTLVAIQYWFYYAYNPGVWNNHEGDWEMIEVLAEGTDAQRAAYAQHESGGRMAWDDVTREGTHPYVYVALGSHASYFRPYEARIGITGDRMSDAGPRLRPADYTIVNVGEVATPTPGNEWIQFAGRWGEFSIAYEARAESGPPGPAYRQNQEMFDLPDTWAAGLSVPSGAMLFLNWLLANLLTFFLAVFAVVVLIRLALLFRLHWKTKAGRKLWPYAHLRPMDRKSVAMLIAVVGLVVGLVAFLLPWYVVSVNANVPGFLVTNGQEDLLRIDGVGGVTLNPFRPDGSPVQVNALPLPIGLMLAITTLYFLFRVAGTKTSRRLGSRYIAKGVVAVLPFVLVLFIAALVLPILGGSGEDPGRLGVAQIFGLIAASPFGGSNTVTDPTGAGGSATISWGFGIGAWLLLVSAVLMIIAGILARSQSYSFLPQWYLDGHEAPPEGWAPAAGEPPVAKASVSDGAVMPATSGSEQEAAPQAAPGIAAEPIPEPASAQVQESEPEPAPQYEPEPAQQDEPEPTPPSEPEPTAESEPAAESVADLEAEAQAKPEASTPPVDESQIPLSDRTGTPGWCRVCGAPLRENAFRCEVCDTDVL